MADTDVRVETLEDEIKVLKGEVRRTLVDLRALLMSADSPMNEGSFGRRMAGGEGDLGGGPGLTKEEVLEMIGSGGGGPGLTKEEVLEMIGSGGGGSGLTKEEVQKMVKEATDAARAAAPAPPPAAPGQPNIPAPAAAPAPAGLGPGPGAPPPGMSGMFGVGAGAPPGPPPGAPPTDLASVDQDRRLEEQQRRLEEQQRRMEDQERRIEEQARDAARPDPALAAQERRLKEQQRQIEEQERKLEEQGRDAAEPDPALIELKRQLEEQQQEFEKQKVRSSKSNRAEATLDSLDEEDRIAPKRYDFAEDEDEEDQEEERVLVLRESASSPRRPRPPLDDEDSDDWREEERSPVGRRRNSAPEFYEEETVTRRSPGKVRRERDYGDRTGHGDPDRPRGDRTGHGEPDRPRGDRRAEGRSRNGAHDGRARAYADEPEEERHSPHTRNGFGSRVYDEYLDLLSETEELEAGAEDGGAERPIDINLLASLTRWASISKRRVGGQRLNDILDLYSESGHLTPRLRALLAHLADLVEDVPAETSRDAQDCVDLLSHLHGILAGGVALYDFRHAKAAS